MPLEEKKIDVYLYVTLTGEFAVEFIDGSNKFQADFPSDADFLDSNQLGPRWNPNNYIYILPVCYCYHRKI